MKTFHFSIFYCSIIALFIFAGCEVCPDLPLEKTDYRFEYKTRVDARRDLYPSLGIDQNYLKDEELSDKWKQEARKQVPPLSNAELTELGNSIHTSYFSSLITNHAKSTWAKEITSNMNPHLAKRAFPHHVFTIKSEYLNAFTIPGGNIYVTTALLDAVQSPDELAFIIGHEFGHNENDHTRENARFYRYCEKMCNDFGFLGPWVAAYSQVDFARSGKADELECDIAAIYLMYRAGYKPEKAIDGLELLKRHSTPKSESGWENLLWTVFGTHPWTEDRIEYVGKYLKRSKVNVGCEEYLGCRAGIVMTAKPGRYFLREYPSVYSEVVAEIPKNKEVKVVCDCIEQEYEKDIDWLYVQYNNNGKMLMGWIDKKCIK